MIPHNICMHLTMTAHILPKISLPIIFQFYGLQWTVSRDGNPVRLERTYLESIEIEVCTCPQLYK